MSPAARGLLLSFLIGLASSSGHGEEQASTATLELYRAKCQSCHMADGNSPLEPLSFVDSHWKHGSKPDDVARVIGDGVPGSAMLAFKSQLTREQISDLVAYVRSFDKSLKQGNQKK